MARHCSPACRRCGRATCPTRGATATKKASATARTSSPASAARSSTGEWPLRDYPSEKAVLSQRMLQPQWPELVRDRITHVAADDDINYTVLGMRVLEEHGTDFTRPQLMAIWLYNLPTVLTF